MDFFSQEGNSMWICCVFGGVIDVSKYSKKNPRLFGGNENKVKISRHVFEHCVTVF